MSAYEFAEEVGLKLLGAYPVRRDGEKVYVLPGDLTAREITIIHLACNSLSIELGQFAVEANQREIKLLWEMQTPEEQEEEITNPAVQHKIRGKGWLRWNQLTPEEQAKIRTRHEASMAKITLTPEQQVTAMETRAKRMAMQAGHPEVER